MVTRRRVIIAFVACALTPFAALSQSTKVFRIGLLSPGSATTLANRLEALRTELRALGYIEGLNLIIEPRYAEGKHDRLPDLAADLVRLKVDVIVTHATISTRAAKNVTSSIPIVMAAGADAARAGLIESLARPGGNITGVNSFSAELSAKRLSLLKEAIPRMNRVAVPFDATSPAVRLNVQTMERTANHIKVRLHQIPIQDPHNLEHALAAISRLRVDAMVLPEDAMLTSNAKLIANYAATHKLPLIGNQLIADDGAFLGYGEYVSMNYQRVAAYIDKILKGAKPGDLPVEQPAKFEFVVNMKTAKTLGIDLPQSILVRADRVIE